VALLISVLSRGSLVVVIDITFGLNERYVVDPSDSFPTANIYCIYDASSVSVSNSSPSKITLNPLSIAYREIFALTVVHPDSSSSLRSSGFLQ